MNKLQELVELLGNMDVPEGRKNDLNWLARNLAIRNAEHLDFVKAKNLISELRNFKLCEQSCGAIATVYAGGSSANDWAGYYCENCVPSGFSVWDKHPNGIINNNDKKRGK